MKKTLIISTLALSVSSFASASVFDIMNLSAEQTEAVEQVRENKKLEDAERKRKIENEQAKADQQLAKQEYNESTQMPQQKAIDPASINQVNQSNNQQYAAIDYSQFAVNARGMNPSSDKEVQAIVNAQIGLPQISQQEAINVQQHNERVMMSEFEKIQQKANSVNPFPNIKENNE